MINVTAEFKKCLILIVLITFFVFLSILFWGRVSGAISRIHASDLRIVIVKERQLLEVYKGEKKIRAYRVCLGLNPYGPKRASGDKKTPEGEYFICYKSADSRFHRFLGISYPNIEDSQFAFENGRISLDVRDSIIESIKNGKNPPWDTELGGWVGIHGYPSDYHTALWTVIFYPKPHNWTDGCIALWNFEVEELYSMVPLGTPVTILP